MSTGFSWEDFWGIGEEWGVGYHVLGIGFCHVGPGTIRLQSLRHIILPRAPKTRSAQDVLTPCRCLAQRMLAVSPPSFHRGLEVAASKSASPSPSLRQPGSSPEDVWAGLELLCFSSFAMRAPVCKTSHCRAAGHSPFWPEGPTSGSTQQHRLRSDEKDGHHKHPNVKLKFPG